MDDLSTKSSASQVSRLINALGPNKASLSTPFIRLTILSEDDDEEDETEAVEHAKAVEEIKMERVMEKLMELEEAATSLALPMGKREAKNAEREVLIGGIPPRIA